ncbi:hypothetical protein BDZ85DRAFT_241012 [Elsinoe ampelina]|uniref:Apple domain-containing protein n=1 Tax=Elsinoe ampelina TaxID=302913 RepID=A0A6A6G4R0_9PEZI|nr:hypothetical protein BDZ85DRAFT_241012 [Elsinoe ampelina]
MHNQKVLAAAFIGLAAASPAPQNLDLAAIINAPAATISGPSLAAISQTSVINTQALIASISNAVTTTAAAKITGAAAANAANIVPSGLSKRDTESSGPGLTGMTTPANTAATASATTATTAATTASVAVVQKVATTASSAASSVVSSAAVTPSSVASSASGAVAAGAGSATSSAAGACATTPEDGTYCGFINPEDPCAPQPDGYGQNITNPDTVDNWMAYAPFQQLAFQAATPSGYVKTFNNLNASASASSYMGLWTLKSYSPSDCAAICNNNTGCTSFNIFIERDPSLNPCKNDSTAYTPWGYWCPLPSSITNYKCTLWGSNLDASVVTNAGGWRGDFNVVITGSNGYDKTNVTTPVAIATYDPPQNCSDSGINGGSYWLGSKFFAGAFNPQLCAAYANATSATNEAAAIAAGQSNFTPCQMFNAYHIYKNNIPMGTYCSLYNAQLSTKWASVKGSWSGNNYYGVRNSWQYQLTTPRTGKCGSY